MSLSRTQQSVHLPYKRHNAASLANPIAWPWLGLHRCSCLTMTLPTTHGFESHNVHYIQSHNWITQTAILYGDIIISRGSVRTNVGQVYPTRTSLAHLALVCFELTYLVLPCFFFRPRLQCRSIVYTHCRHTLPKSVSYACITWRCPMLS